QDAIEYTNVTTVKVQRLLNVCYDYVTFSTVKICLNFVSFIIRSFTVKNHRSSTYFLKFISYCSLSFDMETIDHNTLTTKLVIYDIYKSCKFRTIFNISIHIQIGNQRRTIQDLIISITLSNRQ